MIVKARKDLIKKTGFDTPTKVIIENHYYFVYAIEGQVIHKRYYLIDEVSEIPIAYNVNLFHIIDPAIPERWLTVKRGRGLFKQVFTSFPEWAGDLGKTGSPGFYERLTDSSPGDEEEKILVNYSKLADETLRKYQV